MWGGARSSAALFCLVRVRFGCLRLLLSLMFTCLFLPSAAWFVHMLRVWCVCCCLFFFIIRCWCTVRVAGALTRSPDVGVAAQPVVHIVQARPMVLADE